MPRDSLRMGSETYPTNENGTPVCARPTDEGEPCFRPVAVPGAPCADHRGESPMDDERVVWRPQDPDWSLD